MLGKLPRHRGQSSEEGRAETTGSAALHLFPAAPTLASAPPLGGGRVLQGPEPFLLPERPQEGVMPVEQRFAMLPVLWELE